MLFWSCRNAPLGVPVADDNAFLARLLFQQPLDWLDSMGAAYYWRPVGRQLYFSLIGHGMLAMPAIVPAFHVALLLLYYAFAYRVARRGFEPPVAALIAAFPLAAEPARALLGWASGGQHLLALAGIAITVHEALAGRFASAGLAAFAAMASHEIAVLVLPALPAIAWFRTRRPRSALAWAGVAALAASLVVLGHVVARAHGMELPTDHGARFELHRIFEVVDRTLVAAMNLEDLPPTAALAFGGGYAIVALAALAALARPAVRARVGAAAPVWMGGALWFVAGAIPLAGLLFDWNGWRTIVPMAGLGLAIIGVLGRISLPFAATMFALRLAVLAVVPPASAIVEAHPPASASQSSFPRLARIQRTVESTRTALVQRFPTLPREARVRYWLIPALTEFGFTESDALRVWYRDSTLHWEPFAGVTGLKDRTDALVEYNAFESSPATVIEPAAMALFARALEAMAAGDARAADTLLAACFRAQPIPSEPFFASLAYNRARVALQLGEAARAESLARLDLQWAGESARHHIVKARIAAVRGNREAAGKELERALTLEPENPEAIEIARDLGFIDW